MGLLQRKIVITGRRDAPELKRQVNKEPKVISK